MSSFHLQPLHRISFQNNYGKIIFDVINLIEDRSYVKAHLIFNQFQKTFEESQIKINNKPLKNSNFKLGRIGRVFDSLKITIDIDKKQECLLIYFDKKDYFYGN